MTAEEFDSLVDTSFEMLSRGTFLDMPKNSCFSSSKVLSAVWTIPVYAGGTYHNTVYLGTYLTYYSG
ncbi:MAG: hypothetical protein WAW16_04235 [Candidatus Cryosericum sp.]